jgi:hypothetical protein
VVELSCCGCQFPLRSFSTFAQTTRRLTKHLIAKPDPQYKPSVRLPWSLGVCRTAQKFQRVPTIFHNTNDEATTSSDNRNCLYVRVLWHRHRWMSSNCRILAEIRMYFRSSVVAAAMFSPFQPALACMSKSEFKSSQRSFFAPRIKTTTSSRPCLAKWSIGV